jgi:hypothetical protein
LVPLNACLPITSINLSAECIAAASTNLREVLRLPKLRTVIIAFNWALPKQLVNTQGQLVDNAALEPTIAGLNALIGEIRNTNRQVIVLGPIAEPGWDLPSRYSRQLQFNRPVDQPLSRTRADFDRQFQYAISMLTKRDDFVFVPMHEIQCSESSCRYLIDGQSLFADSNHLATSALPRWKRVIQEALHHPALKR